MRRIFNNSTAIAVGVALLMPHAGIAQAAVSPTPNAEAAQAASDRATEMPDLQKALQMELDAGLTAEQLTCPMNAPTPCPAGLRFTPRGVAVEVAEDGTIADATIGLTALGLEGLATDAAAVLLGERPSEDLFAEAADLARAASSPIEDQRGPVDYKRHLAGVLTQRALRGAAARSLGQEA